MKILFETDPHFKELGSMSNESRYNPKYSTRLDLIIESFSWFYKTARDNNVDLIVHGGDILDKPLILAKEAHAIEESFAYNTTGIKEFVLVGNHDRKDLDTNALAILRNYSNVTVVDKPMKYKNVSFLPFTSTVDLKVLEEISSDILFSHVDIVGTKYAKNIFCTKGFDPDTLKNYFKAVFNGHIHMADRLGIVANTGAFIGSGLGDDYTNGLPSALLIDTDTGDVQRIVNPHAILYFTVESNDLAEIKKKLEGFLQMPNKFYLRVQCLNEVKSEVRLMIDKYMDENKKILSSIIISQVRHKEQVANEKVMDTVKLTARPVEILFGFLKTVPDAKLPMSRAEMEALLMSDYTLGDIQ